MFNWIVLRHLCHRPYYNLYKESCPLIGWIMFVILTIYHQVTKHGIIAYRLGRQECKNYLLLHNSAFILTLKCSVFPIQSSYVEVDVWLVKCFASGFAWAKVVFQYFLLNLFKNLNLCTSYIKQVMNVFSFVQWTIYFHSAKDKIFHSTQLRLIDWNISPFTLWKYLYHCTHKHSLFVHQYCPVLILWCHGGALIPRGVGHCTRSH